MAIDLDLSGEKITLFPEKEGAYKILSAIGGIGDGVIEVQTNNYFFSLPTIPGKRRKINLSNLNVNTERITVEGRGSNLKAFLQFKNHKVRKYLMAELTVKEFYSNNPVKIEIPKGENSVLTYVNFSTATSVKLELCNAGLNMGYNPLVLTNSAIIKDLYIPLQLNSYFYLTGTLIDGTLAFMIAKEV